MPPLDRLCLPALLGALGAGACGGDQFSDEGAGGATSTCPAGGLESFTEDFSATLSPAKWGSYVTTKGTIESSGDELLLRPAPDASHYVGIISRESYPLDGCATWIEVKQVLDLPAKGDTYFSVRLNDVAGVEIGVTPHSSSPSGLGMYFDVKEGVNHLSLDVDYDAAAHRWWRIRFPVDYAAFDTSPDGKLWTERYTAPRPASMSSGPIELGSGTWSANVTQPTAIMDNVNVSPP